LGFFGLFSDPIMAVFFLLTFLITIVVHEVAHAYVAWRLGDPTARAMGRITLNPLRHLDPFGFIMLMVVGFGWAKPVQINPRNFRNEKAGMAISALAGPASNILLAFAGLIFLNIVLFVAINSLGDFRRELLFENFRDVAVNSAFIGRDFVSGGLFEGVSPIMISAILFLGTFVRLNIFFAVFNMIPIPPLDGSRIVNYFLPPRLSRYYEYVERYGFIILMALLWTQVLSRPLIFLSVWIFMGINFLVSPVIGFFM